MAYDWQNFKGFHKKQPIWNTFKIPMRLLFKKPEIINLAGDLEQKSIVIANHSAKSGPPSLDMYYPIKTAKWGAHEMLGNFKSRKEYLRDILYIKKCGKKPGFINSLKSTIMAIFSPMVYKGMWMMPTYTDGRLALTIKNSIKVLESGSPVMVYPENSNNGYKDVLTQLFPGFVMLAMRYYKNKGEDLPVYPVYYSIKKRLMVIGKPLYVQDMVKEGLDRYQIADRYLEVLNGLYFEYVVPYDRKKK